MRASVIRAVCVALAVCWLGLSTGTNAQDQPSVTLFLPGTDIIRTTSADGVVLLRASNGQLLNVNGANAGTASLTSVVAHPTMSFLPTFITADLSGIGRVEITSIESNFSFTPNFRRATGLLDRLFAPVDATVVRGGFNGSTPGNGFVAFKVSLQPTVPVPPTNFNFALDFTESRTDRVIGDTGTSFRNNSRLNFVASYGRKDPFGTNFSFSLANGVQAYNTNFLEAPGGGALVTCRATPFSCWWRGVGAYSAFAGTADTLDLALLGVTGNAGSTLVYSQQLTATQPGHGPCPPGEPPPPPAGLLGVQRVVDSRLRALTLSWDSVACARLYNLQTRVDGRIITDVQTTRPSVEEIVIPVFETLEFRVAAIDDRGVLGTYSPWQRAIVLERP